MSLLHIADATAAANLALQEHGMREILLKSEQKITSLWHLLF